MLTVQIGQYHDQVSLEEEILYLSRTFRAKLRIILKKKLKKNTFVLVFKLKFGLLCVSVINDNRSKMMKQEHSNYTTKTVNSVPIKRKNTIKLYYSVASLKQTCANYEASFVNIQPH